MKRKIMAILFTVVIGALASAVFVACGKGGGEKSLESVAGNTYKITKAQCNFSDENAKTSYLEEVGAETEDELIAIYINTNLTMVFTDNEKVTVKYTFDGENNYNFYYSLSKDRKITFYKTAEDKQNGEKPVKNGIFRSTFSVSENNRTISIIYSDGGSTPTVTMTCTVVGK